MTSPSRSRCGTGDDHCCWIDGAECEFLLPAAGGRDKRCAIRSDHSSWAAAHEDPRYQPVRAALRRVGATYDCGDWPPPRRRCNACGEEG